MIRLRKIGVVLFLLVSLTGGIVGNTGYTLTSQAAEVTRYYIYLDQTGYEVTKEQYQQIYSNQNDQQALLQCLRQILGDRMPASFSVVYGRVVTSDDGQTASIPPTTTVSDLSDYVIQEGVLVSYKGTSAIVQVPSGVTRISSLAFYNNSNVKAVILPSSVTSVEKYAFANCSSLKYIVFPKETVSFGSKIIYQCNKLTNIVAPKGSKAYRYAQNNNLVVTTGKSAKLSQAHCYLLVGDSQKNVLYNNISSVTWKSSKKSVVTVSSGGTLKAKKKGTATVTATAGGKEYTCKVTVYTKNVDMRVDQVIRSVIRKDMTRYEKVKAVHNWMIRNVKYDYYRLKQGYIPRVSHTAKGALVKKIAVCDGYAHAFQMIMKKLKIPCRFVVGNSGGVGHAWNMVKLGGKWYHVDVTFDDPIINGRNTNTTPYYTYFMKSSSVMKKSHNWVKSKYPKCTSKKYN